MEPKSHEPHENIDHEIDDGHEDKAVHILEPLEHKSEQCNNGIKTNVWTVFWPRLTLTMNLFFGRSSVSQKSVGKEHTAPVRITDTS